jgi:hypothetical protein
MYSLTPVKICISCLIVVAAVTSPLLMFFLFYGARFHDIQRIIQVSCSIFGATIAVV